jgi:hypothetical protein
VPRVGFEPTILVYERAKTFHVLDCVATVIGWFHIGTSELSSKNISVEVRPVHPDGVGLFPVRYILSCVQNFRLINSSHKLHQIRYEREERELTLGVYLYLNS